MSAIIENGMIIKLDDIPEGKEILYDYELTDTKVIQRG